MNIFQFRKDERGSFTIEAAIIFPVIFFVTIMFIIFSLYIYQKVQLYYIANQMAERAAYVWSNSHKDPITGEIQGASGAITPDNTKEFLNRNQRDGLYWRVGELLGIVYGAVTRTESPAQTAMNFSKGSAVGASSSKSGEKLTRIIDSGMLPAGVSGNITYKNYVVYRSIEVELSNPLKLPPFLEKIVGNSVKAQATSTITEPVEFIRNVEFVRMYSKRVKKHFSNQSQVESLMKE
ncbi:TadE/TadG family type IV pilus assembly protein [Caldalkalibacillus mannanilyticus]|uniref:TadE/TadG family type IV pilus assembly protein n=1 Tax=Caldalkalibacillus mannanilyticus TaxID=1418 RepID=UPI00046873F1|nr:hypothetical protein [Caldalkalibacillus mannanilyticus]